MIKKPVVTCCFIVCGLFFLIGCTSVPHVDRWKKVDEGKYSVVIDRDYLKDKAELNYAMNSFAQELELTTYSVEKYGPNDFYVTTPGDQKTENLAEVRHFHTGRTVGLIIPPIVAGILIGLISFASQ
jgi:hypothetical protein